MVRNLLAQKKEMKRLEQEMEKRRREEEEETRRRGAEEGDRAVEEFERVTRGMEGEVRASENGVESKVGTMKVERGVKRKFELDEEEMLMNVKEERARARKALDEEQVGN